jgi:hypothetical protein
MLYDCFLFSGLGAEQVLLDIRLRELHDVVEHFVLVEATKTFTGQSKPIYMGDHHKAVRNLRYVVVNDMPETQNPWEREAFQRNAILRGLTDAKDDDLALMSDVDEIPRAETLPRILAHGTLLAFEQEFFYYNFNTRARGKWLGTRMCSVGDLRRWSPQEARRRFTDKVARGGWHLTWFGSDEDTATKIRSFSHQEYNKPEFTDLEQISARRQKGADLFDRPVMQFERVNGNLSHLPQCVQLHPDWYQQFFATQAEGVP